MTDTTPRLSEAFEGSISEGTMNSRHLVPRFIAVLHSVWPQHPLCAEYGTLTDALNTIGLFTRDQPGDVADLLGFWECEQMGYLTEALFDAMNDIAPKGTYFGASDGDGASYGYWPLDGDDDYDEQEIDEHGAPDSQNFGVD